MLVTTVKLKHTPAFSPVSHRLYNQRSPGDLAADSCDLREPHTLFGRTASVSCAPV